MLRKENPRGSHESTLGTPRDQRSTDSQLLPPNIHFTLIAFDFLYLSTTYFSIDPSSHHVRGHFGAMRPHRSRFARKTVEAA
jgi:hypothetical protein